MLEHERVHILRIKELGVIKWYLKYLFSSKFRLEEELLAYNKTKEIYNKYNLNFDIDYYAKILSSWLYFKCVSYKEAKGLLK